MKNTTGKVSPGDPFIPPPAAIWNNMVDAGAAYGLQRLNSGAQSPTRPRSTDLIKARNDSGADRRRGEILEISGKAITDLSDETTWLKGVEPSSGFFGILKEPVLDGSTVDLQVSGVCLALVTIVDMEDTHADAESGQYVLRSGTSGPLEILYAPEATGEQQCVVRFAGGGSGGGGSILFFTITEIDCPTEYEPEATGYWYVTPDYYSGGCGTIPGLVDDPYSDYDGLVEVRPPLCALGGATMQAADLIGATAEAFFMYPVNDCGNGFWIAKDPCVDAGC